MTTEELLEASLTSWRKEVQKAYHRLDIMSWQRDFDAEDVVELAAALGKDLEDLLPSQVERHTLLLFAAGEPMPWFTYKFHGHDPEAQMEPLVAHDPEEIKFFDRLAKSAIDDFHHYF